jgi:hypothetical protein
MKKTVLFRDYIEDHQQDEKKKKTFANKNNFLRELITLISNQLVL